MRRLATMLIGVRRMPLRRQLMWAFAGLSIGATGMATMSVAAFAGHRMHQDLRGKSVQYARQLQRQLEPVIAFDDRVSAQEAFESLAGDRDVEGLGVYAEDGQLLEGRGARPAALRSLQAELPSDAQHVVAVAEIQLRDGRRGRVYVELNSRSIDALARRNAWLAALIAAGVVTGALLLGADISRRIARRLERIADAAKRMALGESDMIVLDDGATDAIGDLAQAFNAMVRELAKLAMERQQMVSTERERLELLVVERTVALEQSRQMFKLIAESTHAIPFTLNLTQEYFSYIGSQLGATCLAYGVPTQHAGESGTLEQILPRALFEEARRQLDECVPGQFDFVVKVQAPNGKSLEGRWTGNCEVSSGCTVLRGLIQDVTDLRHLERELIAAQKLESVGRLAAGVAHEINTPVQFVADNVEFVTNSVRSMTSVIKVYRALREAADSGTSVTAASQSAGEAETTEDIDYILEEAPIALGAATEGLQRIAAIVRSMKEFAHPDQAVKSAVDLNRAIESTLVIARNEYKYVAEVKTDLNPLPPVYCHPGEINQVVLNLLVNAAHAIEDVVKGGGHKGLLRVSTRQVGDEVEIAICDTGTGIPVAAREKIFEPFFTTKEVGKGTGQGLALARNVIVNKHGGSLRFETELGQGTTFFIRLPIGNLDATTSLAA